MYQVNIAAAKGYFYISKLNVNLYSQASGLAPRMSTKLITFCMVFVGARAVDGGSVSKFNILLQHLVAWNEQGVQQVQYIFTGHGPST